MTVRKATNNYLLRFALVPRKYAQSIESWETTTFLPPEKTDPIDGGGERKSGGAGS